MSTNVSVCAWCQRERGETPVPNESHTICPAHKISVLAAAGIGIKRDGNGVAQPVPVAIRPQHIRLSTDDVIALAATLQAHQIEAQLRESLFLSAAGGCLPQSEVDKIPISFEPGSMARNILEPCNAVPAPVHVGLHSVPHDVTTSASGPVPAQVLSLTPKRPAISRMVNRRAHRLGFYLAVSPVIRRWM